MCDIFLATSRSAYLLNESVLQVNKMGPPHMCPIGSKRKSSMANMEWVAIQAMSILKDNPKETTTNIQTILSSKYNIVLPY